MRALLIAIAIAALALPATARAAPEDPPVESVQPAEGAVLPVNADGIEVRYTCPEPYRARASRRSSRSATATDYGVYFATSPALGNDGRLSQANLVAISGSDAVQDNDIPVGQCRGFMADPATSRRPSPAPTTGRRGGPASPARAA